MISTIAVNFHFHEIKCDSISLDHSSAGMTLNAIYLT